MICILALISCGTTKYKEPICSYSEEALSRVQQRAEAGNGEAQFRVAGWHRKGLCLPHDFPKAMVWYHRSAESGHLGAQLKLAEIYLGEGYRGYGQVTIDEKEAEKWLTTAASQGSSQAQLRLASFYRTVVKDTEKAIQWYQKAAKQGDIGAIRSLGYIYLHGEGGQGDLDEAEKWFRLAVQRGDSTSRTTLEQIRKEKDPATSARKNQEQAAASQKQLAEQQERFHREETTRQAAKQAKARFSLVRVSVVEERQSKRARMNGRQELVSLKELKSPSVSSKSDELLGEALSTIFYLGPYGPLIYLYGAGIVYGIEGIKQGIETRKEKAKIRPALKTLIKTFAEENIEQDFTEALLATAAQKHAPNLLVSDSNITASKASHHLNIQLKEFKMIAIPSSWHMARLWATTQVKLTNQGADDSAFEKRFCYGSASFSMEATAKDILVFKQHLSKVYRGLSNQILSEALGLASDHKALPAWSKTQKMCSSATEPIRVARGYYQGETKDGKPHGYGEIRYDRGFYLGTTYQGNFVNGRANGAGRCRSTSGWRNCTFANGHRL